MVSTCVGEEGLDIGEVDLIIFYDVSKSPIRLIQRMGRTGRKREGRVIVLLTEGKQEAIYNSAIYSKNSIKKALLDKNRLIPYLSRAPRMVPKGINPICHKMELKPQATFVGKIAAKRKKSSEKRKEAEVSTENPSVSTTRLVKDTSYAVSNGYLTTNELDEWTNKFKLNSEETIKVPKLKSRVETWSMSRNDIMEKLKRDQGKSAISAPNEIDLSEWILWQDSYQKRHLISQSKTSQLLENALTFIRNGNEVLTSLHPSTERQTSLLQGADNYMEQNPEETEIPKMINIEESDNLYKTNGAEIEKIISQSPIEFEKGLDEGIGTPKHILDVVENEQSLLNDDNDDDDDSQFWQSWFPIDEAVCKLRIRPIPDTMKMLKSIPDPKIIEAFDINASWKKIDEEYKDNSLDANVHSNLSAGCEFAGKPKCDSKSQDKYSDNLSLNVMSKQMIKGYESLLTSTPSANMPRNTNLSNISPIVNENSRLNTSRKLTKFRAIPEEDEENNEELESSNATCKQNSVFTATQLVSFVNKTALNTTNDISTKGIQNRNIESRKLMKNKSGMIQNSVNLTAEERKIVQKLSFDDTDKISDSLKEAFNISYDDVVIRGCPILTKTSNHNSERNQVPCEIEQLSENSSLVSNNGRNCSSAHRTLNDLVKCSPISKDMSFDRQLYVSSFDIVLDDSISLFSESDISAHTFIQNADFKLPDLLAYETKSKTPSRIKKQDKSPSKLSPARLEFDEKSIPKETIEKNFDEYDQINIPHHFDREVFSQLPPDIQNELLQNEGSNVSSHHTKSPDDDNIQSQIYVCKAKGKRVLISSSEEDLPSESDSPIVNRGPKVVKNSESDTSENDQSKNLIEMKNNPTSLKSSNCRARKFIDMEAVLSQSGDDFADSISEEAGIDGYEASFVDDATQKPTENIDQQAIYLRSVRSPILQSIIDRPPRKQMRREDIFSQFDDIEDEYDLQDSFVVDSDAIEYESKTDPLDFIDEFDDTKYKNSKAKGEKSKLKGRKRGRILTKACSSSSDEDQRGKFIGKPKRLVSTPKSDEKTTNDSVNESTHQNEINIDSEAKLLRSNAGNIQPEQINVTETEEIKGTCSYESHLQSPKSNKPDSLTAPLVKNKDQHRHSVLISALELQKAQEVVSLLRHDHGINVVVSRTGIDVGASYMMSSRCALIRVVTQEFCNASNR